MVRAVVILAVVGALAWLIVENRELLEDDDTPAPIEYPVVDGGGGVGGVGTETEGVLGN